MATSGSVNGNNVDGSDGSYLDWQIYDQSVEQNYSRISWQVGWRFGSTSCRGLRNGTAVINGVTVYYNHNSGDGIHSYNSGHDHRPKLQCGSGITLIWHAVDGTASVGMWVTMTGYPGLVSAGSGWFNMPQIPRMPAAPGAPTLSVIRHTTVNVAFTDGYSALPIDARQIGWGTDSGSPQYTMSSDGSDTVTGLTPGRTYYFWARTHNSSGWGPWSASSTTRSIGGVLVRVGTENKIAIPYVRVSGVWQPAQPWVRYTGVWKETT
jgi:hypothetical protein